MAEVLNNSLTRFWDWIDSRGIVRRATLGAVIWLNWVAGEHAYSYADAALRLGKSDAGIGAVIAAFTAPAALLAGHAFKTYSESRQ